MPSYTVYHSMVSSISSFHITFYHSFVFTLHKEKWKCLAKTFIQLTCWCSEPALVLVQILMEETYIRSFQSFQLLSKNTSSTTHFKEWLRSTFCKSMNSCKNKSMNGAYFSFFFWLDFLLIEPGHNIFIALRILGFTIIHVKSGE